MRGLIYRLTEPAGTIPDERKIFSNHDLKILIVPLFLEQFLEADMIRETKVTGRRRSYILTEKGREMLEKEYKRICAQARDYRLIFGEDREGEEGSI